MGHFSLIHFFCGRVTLQQNKLREIVLLSALSPLSFYIFSISFRKS